jgi:hypothetical protein
MALGLLRKMFIPSPGSSVPQIHLATVALVIAAYWAMRGPNIYDMSHEWRPIWVAILALGFGASLALIAGDRASPFLYFQF